MFRKVRSFWAWVKRPRRAEVSAVYDWSTLGLGLVVTSGPRAVALILGPVQLNAAGKPQSPPSISFTR